MPCSRGLEEVPLHDSLLCVGTGTNYVIVCLTYQTSVQPRGVLACDLNFAGAREIKCKVKNQSLACMQCDRKFHVDIKRTYR